MKNWLMLIFVSFVFILSSCSTNNSDNPISSQNIVPSKNLAASLIPGAGYYFQNKPISLYGDPEISKIYESTASIYTPPGYSSSYWATFIHMNLTIPNPQTIQCYVNGTSATLDNWGGGLYHLDYYFQPITNYTVVVRVIYPQHYSDNTCGTWSMKCDFLTSM